MATSSNYLGIPNFKPGQSPSIPPPKSTSKAKVVNQLSPINTIGSPEYERDQNKIAMEQSKLQNLPLLSNPDIIETKGSIATDAAAAAIAVAAAKAEQQQSMQAIQDTSEYKNLLRTFTAYGMSDFVGIYLQIKADNPKADKDTIESILKTDPKYNTDPQGNPKGYAKRFAGNVALVKAGKIPLDDADYIKAELGYEKAFKGYGLDAMANQKSYADLIGNDVSADEATTRIQLGYDSLAKNPKVLEAFRKFYPTLGDGDIVAGILNSKEQLPALQRKVDAAQIGGAALRQGLQTSEARAEELRGLGISQATAETGYNKIAGYLTDAQKLAQIGNEDQFTQTTAEQSQLQGLASAQRKEALLAQKEINRFSVDEGRQKNALGNSNTAGML